MELWFYHRIRRCWRVCTMTPHDTLLFKVACILAAVIVTLGLALDDVRRMVLG